MTEMIRATTYLTAEQYQELREAAERRDISVSQMLRRMVKQIIAERQTLNVDDLHNLGTEPDLLTAICLREQILLLSKDESTIILLCVVGGYSSPEISKMLKKPAGTIRSKLSRALDKLSAAMA